MSTIFSRPMSVKSRLTIMVFLVEVLLLFIISLILYWGCRMQFYQSLDSAILANAQAIASLVEGEEDEPDGIEFEFSDEQMQRFKDPENPDVFAVYNEKGVAIEKSGSFNKVPEDIFLRADISTCFNFAYNKKPYRGVFLPIAPNIDGSRKQQIHLVVFFATSRASLLSQLQTIIGLLFITCVAGLILSVIMARLAVIFGLIPLNRLADAIAQIDSHTLDHRLNAATLPPDLKVMAQAINDLLSRMERAFQREKEFSADAAHELRTPLATIKSGVQASMLTVLNDDRTRAAMEDILKDIEHLELLCNSLLTLTTTQQSFDAQSLSLNEWLDVIAGVVESYHKRVKDNNSRLRFEIPVVVAHNNPWLRAGIETTERIVRNLIDNALLHGGTGVDINIYIGLSNAGVDFIIEDSGPGIDPQDVSKLFQRFFRADKARSRSTGGAGLGLAICQTLAVSLKGNMRYESLSPQGCRFIWHVQFAECCVK